MINRHPGGAAAEDGAAAMTPDTRTRILDAAERLFAADGIQGVSVRSVLAAAGANPALAHYHFGGRDGLVHEVLRRRIEPLNARRVELLAAAEAAAPGRPALEDVLHAFLAPVIDLLRERPAVARLIGQLHVTADRDLRHLYAELFDAALRRFSTAIRPALPSALPAARRASRAHFVFGAMVHTLTNYDDLELMARGRYKVQQGRALCEELVAFCAAGLTAPVVGPKRGTR